nr:MAG TPA: hypothetical protein [Caudoviricetes sp.]
MCSKIEPIKSLPFPYRPSLRWFWFSIEWIIKHFTYYMK